MLHGSSFLLLLLPPSFSSSFLQSFLPSSPSFLLLLLPSILSSFFSSFLSFSSSFLQSFLPSSPPPSFNPSFLLLLLFLQSFLNSFSSRPCPSDDLLQLWLHAIVGLFPSMIASLVSKSPERAGRIILIVVMATQPAVKVHFNFFIIAEHQVYNLLYIKTRTYTYIHINLNSTYTS